MTASDAECQSTLREVDTDLRDDGVMGTMLPLGIMMISRGQTSENQRSVRSALAPWLRLSAMTKVAEIATEENTLETLSAPSDRNFNSAL